MTRSSSPVALPSNLSAPSGVADVVPSSGCGAVNGNANVSPARTRKPWWCLAHVVIDDGERGLEERAAEERGVEDVLPEPAEDHLPEPDADGAADERHPHREAGRQREPEQEARQHRRPVDDRPLATEHPLGGAGPADRRAHDEERRDPEPPGAGGECGQEARADGPHDLRRRERRRQVRARGDDEAGFAHGLPPFAACRFAIDRPTWKSCESGIRDGQT